MAIFLYPLTGLGIFWDWPGRLRPNDTTLQFHHFFWTTFTYLGPFFLIQNYLIIASLFPRHKFIITSIMLIYLVEVQDYLFVNLSYSEVFLNFKGFNLLLTNNLNKYHPHCFYASTWSLIFLTAYLRYVTHLPTLTFISTEGLRKMKSLTYVTGLINSFALFLGSWWAFQEGTWGGWWNWDPSEVLGLIVLLITLLITHKTVSYLTLWSAIQKIFLGALSLFWVYFFTQLNFDLVSHNFGNRFTFFFVNTLFYLDMLLGLTFGLTFFVLLKSKLTWSLKLSSPESNFSRNTLVWVSVLPISWVVLVLGSFHPLINYFLWQYLGVNFWNFTGNYSIFYYVIIIIIYGVFTSKPLNCSGGLLYTTFFSQTTLLSVLLPPSNYAQQSWKTFHTVLSLILASNLLDNQTHTTLISYESNLFKPVLLNLNPELASEVICIEDAWKEKVRIFWSQTSSTTLHSFMNSHSAYETNQFSFYQTKTIFMASSSNPFGNNLLQRNYLHIFFGLFYEATFLSIILLLLYRVKAY